jgi:hypothetical protein
MRDTLMKKLRKMPLHQITGVGSNRPAKRMKKVTFVMRERCLYIQIKYHISKLCESLKVTREFWGLNSAEVPCHLKT